MPRKDPEKQKEYRRQYYLKNKQKEIERAKKYYADNKEKVIEYQKEYQKSNKYRTRKIVYNKKFREKYISDHGHSYSQGYYERNKEKIIEKNKKYKENNKEKVLLFYSKYKEKNRDRIRDRDRKYYKNNKERINKLAKKRLENTKNYFSLYADKLTIDEDPIMDSEGFLMVRDYYTKQYFYPKLRDVLARIYALNGIKSGESHIYSSLQSKQACPVYNAREKKSTNKLNISVVNPFWRKQVISRAEGRCERCGKESDKLIAHHLAPRATCAFDGDIDNGMALCPECHREVHSTDGCRLHELAAEKRKTA